MELPHIIICIFQLSDLRQHHKLSVHPVHTYILTATCRCLWTMLDSLQSQSVGLCIHTAEQLQRTVRLWMRTLHFRGSPALQLGPKLSVWPGIGLPWSWSGGLHANAFATRALTASVLLFLGAKISFSCPRSAQTDCYSSWYACMDVLC